MNYKILVLTILLGILGFMAYISKNTILSRYLSIKFSASKYEDKDENQLIYRFYEPKLKTGELYPLVIYLHGGGQGGKDNLKQLDRVALFLTSSNIQKKYPSFVLAPQCPSGRQWLNTTFKSRPFDHYDQSKIKESPEMRMIAKVISNSLQQYSIDKNRIYIIGFSMGSSGIWDFISRYPDIFAAAVPISGVSDTSTVNKIVHIPIWAFHGENDDIAPVRLNSDMHTLINKAGGNCKLTIFEGEGHGCIKKVIKYPGLADWLFTQKKSQ